MSWIPFLLLMGLWGFLVVEVMTGRLWGPGRLNKIARQKSPILFWAVIAVSVVGLWWISQLLVSASVLSVFSDLASRLSNAGALVRPIVISTEPVEIIPTVDSACPVSADETYGYTPANPVRIGGGDFDGPLRTSAYLQNLRGPGGEVVNYALNGFADGPDGRLNLLTLTYPGHDSPIAIYVDHQRYTDLKAPLGFKCDAPFSLPEP
jgi:hypothetical protein